MIRKRETPESRKSQIISAADLVLLEVGIDRFTVDQVIEQAKIAKGTVYNYYKNKDEMLAELGTKGLDIMQQYFVDATQAHENSVDKVKAMCLACYEFYERYPRYFELVSYMERPDFNINIQGYLKLSYEFQKFTSDIVITGQKRGEIKQSLEPTMVNYIIWACCVGVVQFVESKKKLLKNHHEIDRQQMVNTFASMMTAGIKR